MLLAQFAAIQEEQITLTARKLTRLLEINLSYNVSAGVRNCQRNNPYLRAVSEREIVERMFS